MKKGFNLIELLISLIIISLIAASFIPTLSSKLKHSNVVISQGKINCKKFDSLNRCLLCDKERCAFCSTQVDIKDGYYVDLNIGCDLKECQEKFNNCARCNKNECHACKKGYVVSGGECIKEFSQQACDELLGKGESLFIPTGENSAICALKFNLGDSAKFPIEGIISDIKTAVYSTIGSTDHNAPICWKGNTASPCNSYNTTYSGCNRTVCTFNAAKQICDYYGLRLPSPEELKLFSNYSIGKGDKGLSLCDEASTETNSKSALCRTARNCPYAHYSKTTLEHTGDCNADGVWGADLENTAYSTRLSDNTFSTPSKTSFLGTALSARCVISL